MLLQVNKPRDARVARRVPVQISDEPSRWYAGETIDVSRSGLALRSAHVVPPLTRLEIRLPRWPQDHPSLFGVVRWSKAGRPGRMGLRFQTSNDLYLKQLSNLGTKRIAPGIFIPDREVDNAQLEQAGGGWKPRTTRHACSMSVRCAAPGAPPVDGTLFNISAEGIGLNAPERITPGTELWCMIDLPNGRVARAEGSVVWARLNPAVGRGWSAHGIHVDRADALFYDLFIHRLQLAAHRWESSGKAGAQAEEEENVQVRLENQEPEIVWL